MNLSGNKILITGGATGIGYKMAERFINEDNVVIIVGRRQEVLDLARRRLRKVIIKSYDLSIKSERLDLYNWIATEHSDLNVLINNAGIKQWVDIADEDFFEKAMEEISINIEAPIHLSSLFIKLPSLTTIFNLTSALSFLPVIKTPVFSASKAFLHSFTLSLRELVKNKNIEVIEMIPPALNTDLGGNNKVLYGPDINEYIDSVFEQLREGKIQLTYRFSEAMTKANPTELEQAFRSLNQLD